MNELKSPATRCDCIDAPMSACVAAASCWMSVPPPWSSTWKVNPPKAPRPSIDGGANGMTSPPWMPNIGPRSRLSTACSRCSSPMRWSNGLSATKIRPWFGALPLKLKPITENTPSTSGVPSRSCSASLATLLVYSSDAPAGAWTTVMKNPPSSSGRNDCGTRW